MGKETTQSHRAYLQALHATPDVAAREDAKKELDRKNLTAGEILGELDAKKELDATLAKRAFSLDEAVELERTLPPAEFEKVKPFIEMSRARGEFKLPSDMTRAEFTQHCRDHGKVGPVFSNQEWNALGADATARGDGPTVYEISRQHLLEAQKDGRLHPSQFADEVRLPDEVLGTQLTRRVADMRRFYDVAAEVEKLRSGLKKLDAAMGLHERQGGTSDFVTEPAKVAYLSHALRTLQRSYKSQDYPLERAEGYSALVAECADGRAACKEKGLEVYADFDTTDEIAKVVSGADAE